MLIYFRLEGGNYRFVSLEVSSLSNAELHSLIVIAWQFGRLKVRQRIKGSNVAFQWYD